MKQIILKKYHSASDEQTELMSNLKEGIYPSLDWILHSNTLYGPDSDDKIKPEKDEWPPTDDGNPPYGIQKKKRPSTGQGTPAAAAMTMIAKAMERAMSATCTKASMIQFVKGSDDDIGITLSKVEVEQSSTGEELLDKAKAKAIAERSSLFLFDDRDDIIAQ